MQPVTFSATTVILPLLLSLRVLGWMVMVPPFSGRSVPAPAKGILSVGLGLAMIPGLSSTNFEEPTWSTGLILSYAVAEIATGLVMGFVTMLIFSTVAAAGNLLDLFGGFAISQAFDPLGMSMNTIFGQFHQLLATTLLFATGAHLFVIGGLLSTYNSLPLGAPVQLDAEFLAGLFSLMFTTAVHVAMPMIGVLFLTDLGLAMLTKVAPSLNALSVLFPAKIGVTLLLVGLTFPALPPLIENLTDWTLDAFAQIAQGEAQ